MANRPDPAIDDAKFMKLRPPIMIRVSRIENGRESEILMPSKEGFPQYHGFTHEDGYALGKAVLDFAGGGDYVARATDPDGKTYEWRIYWSTGTYPPRVPSTVAGAATTPMSPYGVAMPQTAGSEWAARIQQISAAGYPPQMVGGGFGFAPHAQVPPAYYPPPPPYYPPTAFAGPAAGPSASERALEARLHQMEMQSVHESHKRELEELRRQVAETRRSPADEDTPTIRALREQNERMTRMLEDQKQQAAQAGMMAMFAQMQTQAQTQFQQIVTLLSQKGVDPTMQLLLANTQHQIDAQKSANEQQVRFLESQADKSTQGTQQIMKQTAEAYNGVFGFMQKALEMQQAMTPAGSPAMDMIGSALNNVADTVKAGFSAKKGESRVKEAEAQAETMKAQAEIIKSQRAAAGMNGAVAPADGNGEAAPANGAAQPDNVVPLRPQETPEQRDLRLFGPAIELIKDMRKAVKDGKLKPAQVVASLEHALGEINGKLTEKEIGALRLINEGLLGDFVEVLLPDASVAFKDDVLAGLKDALEDDEDDGDDAEDAPPPQAS